MPPRYAYYSEQVAPDGTRMALVHVSEREATNIALYDFASQRTTLVTEYQNWEQPELPDAPVWSPDGDELVFSRWDRKTKSELVLVKLEGPSPVSHRYTEHPGARIRPTDWLRDGSAIVAVLQHRDKKRALGLIPIVGGRFRSLRSLGFHDGGRPNASPDGRFIVIETGNVGARNLELVTTDGRTRRVLTAHPADDAQPLWAPDGRHIVFLSRRHGAWALWGTAVQDGRPVGEPFLIQEGMDSATLLNWSPGGALFYNTFVPIRDVFTVSMESLLVSGDAGAALVANSSVLPTTASVGAGTVTFTDVSWVIRRDYGPPDIVQLKLNWTIGNQEYSLQVRWSIDNGTEPCGGLVVADRGALIAGTSAGNGTIDFDQDPFRLQSRTLQGKPIVTIYTYYREPGSCTENPASVTIVAAPS
jgi:dipeptidyl aminopeptidase/acylaminoacyl peptidase